MRRLTMQQAADYLETASVEVTIDKGFAVIHSGINVAGVLFVLVNDCNGQTVLTEGA